MENPLVLVQYNYFIIDIGFHIHYLKILVHNCLNLHRHMTVIRNPLFVIHNLLDNHHNFAVILHNHHHNHLMLWNLLLIQVSQLLFEF